MCFESYNVILCVSLFAIRKLVADVELSASQKRHADIDPHFSSPPQVAGDRKQC